MPPSSWVVNASPLILLAKIQKTDLLVQLAGLVIVPEAVVEEVTVKDDGKFILNAIEKDEHFSIQRNVKVPNYLLAWDLGAGETQVIALGIQIGAKRVVLDDLEARKCAKAFGLNVIGTLGLVARAKDLGVIDRARPVMEQLACSGMHVSPALLSSILAELGE